MLERLNKEGVANLFEFSGTPVNNLVISILKPGTLIRVVTREHKHYVFEVVDPKAKTAHVVRHRPAARSAGYLGVHTVTPVFQIGDIIECANGAAFEITSPVAKLERLDPIIG